MAQSKEEKKEYMKAYYLANKEKMDENKKAWEKANPEKYSKRHNDWQRANPEKRAEHKKRYMLKLNLANKHISRRTLDAWSAQVRERDTACLYCGSTNKLNAHHILSKSKHPDHALFLNNGITLCEPCHIQEHLLNGDL